MAARGDWSAEAFTPAASLQKYIPTAFHIITRRLKNREQHVDQIQFEFRRWVYPIPTQDSSLEIPKFGLKILNFI